MEIQSAATTPRRQTLKEMLLSESQDHNYSPRNVLDSPFDLYASNTYQSSYAYGDTITLRTHFLQSPDEEDVQEQQIQLQRQRCFTVFRRWSTFPSKTCSSGQKLLGFRKTLSFKFNKIAPLSALPDPSGVISGGRSNWRSFRYSEIEAATGFFNPENLIGKGGYSDVYKGKLATGQLVAVKRITRGGREEQGMSFLTELGVLVHVCHPNTATLIGFCVEHGLFLVFEYFPCGSLANMLHGGHVMRWSSRFKVAVGTAKGLQYLHSSCRRRIIHRDIKASNILLGSDFEPQITDFGLAKWLPSEWTHHTVPVEGTFGYLAPEYFFHGIVDEKTDVYAFGVLLLELVTGLRPIDNSQKSLVMKVRPLLESGSFLQLVDSRLKGVFVHGEVQRMLSAARLCIRQSSISRPSMADVVKLLMDEMMSSSTHSTSLWDKFSGEDEFGLNSQCSSTDMSSYTALVFDSSCFSPDLGPIKYTVA